MLAPGQRLLGQVNIEGANTTDKERLLTLAQQLPNAKFPIPKLAIYQIGHSYYDSTRIKHKLVRIQTEYAQKMQAAGTDSAKLGQLLTQRERRVRRKQLALDRGNAIMRLGQPPVLYERALTDKSVEQMTTYLHSQGFFRAVVTATDTAQTRRGIIRSVLYGLHIRKQQPRRDSAGTVRPHRRVAVTYHVAEGQPFVYSLLTQYVPDSAVLAVLTRNADQTLLHLGDRYNEETIGQERLRLENLLKNNGYFDFRQQYITLEADTSFLPYAVRLKLQIANPGPGLRHQAYRLRTVRMVTDANATRTLRLATADTLRRAGSVPIGTPLAGARTALRPVRADTVTLDSVQFAAYKQRYSPRILARKIGIRPGQLYSLARTQSTQRQLADLDMFRF